MNAPISVVIPACNAAQHLPVCLEALASGSVSPLEIIVVDDGSVDNTGDIARNFNAVVLSTTHRSGPALARNLGAKMAKGDIVFFLDADVRVAGDTILKVFQHFQSDPALDALMGAYDNDPACKDFLSQYRNLMHAYVHQTGAEQASTFWSGCGAIRRHVFAEHSGFNESYGRPAIEDIELGYRLISAKRRVLLDRSLQVTHLKRWSFWGLLKTDILDRGIPWTELILRHRFMPNDLNLQLSQRVSVALVFILVALSAGMAVLRGAYVLLPLFAILLLMLAQWWGEILSERKNLGIHATITVMTLFTAIIAYTHHMFGLLPPLIVTPVLLLLRHRYNKRARTTLMARITRWAGILYICGSVAVAVTYLPMHRLMISSFFILVLLALMNSQFYVFLAGKRGLAFMLAAMPFHLLYHFYNGVSFLIGVARHYGRKMVPSRRERIAGTPADEPR